MHAKNSFGGNCFHTKALKSSGTREEAGRRGRLLRLLNKCEVKRPSRPAWLFRIVCKGGRKADLKKTPPGNRKRKRGTKKLTRKSKCLTKRQNARKNTPKCGEMLKRSFSTSLNTLGDNQVREKDGAEKSFGGGGCFCEKFGKKIVIVLQNSVFPLQSYWTRGGPVKQGETKRKRGTEQAQREKSSGKYGGLGFSRNCVRPIKSGTEKKNAKGALRTRGGHF